MEGLLLQEKEKLVQDSSGRNDPVRLPGIRGDQQEKLRDAKQLAVGQI